MASLTDLITYDDKWLSELPSRHHRQQVEDLATRLEPLKQELHRHNKAQINITGDGNVTIKNLPEEMASQIRNMFASIPNS
jgi:hypothetical protein